MLHGELLQRATLKRPLDLVLGELGEVAEIVSVLAARLRVAPELGEPGERELADRLEHREARRAVVGRSAQEQALVDERGEQLQARTGNNAVDGLERGAPGEDGERQERALLFLVQQHVAPVDRRGERPLPQRQVTRTAGQERQALAETVEDRLER